MKFHGVSLYGTASTSRGFLKFLAFYLVLALTFTLTPVPLYALPQGEEVENGEVRFELVDEKTLEIYASANSIVNYQSFDIASNETVSIIQPDAAANSLNRIIGGTATSILGTLLANGNIIIINIAGINIGASANIQAASCIISSLNISNADFLAGRLSFAVGGALSSVTNQGFIKSADGGYVALIGGAVENSGTLLAPHGSVVLASGEKLTLSIDPANMISVVVDDAIKEVIEGRESLVINTGSIYADGGKVYIEGKQELDLYKYAVNQEGYIRANSVAERGGVIILISMGAGIVRQAGTIDASSAEEGVDGGSVKIEGEHVLQKGTILVNAHDDSKAGSVSVVSDKGTRVTSDSLIEAKGKDVLSEGGEVIINSTKGWTEYQENALIDVSGGAQTGDAGFVEISAKTNLDYRGRVVGLAQSGYKGGCLLFDPTNIIIQAGGAHDPARNSAVEADEKFGDHAGQTVTFDPSAGESFDGFGDIWLQAENDITVSSVWNLATSTGNTDVNLKLEAKNDINIDADITGDGTGVFEFAADHDLSGAGAFSMADGTTVSAGSGDITVSSAGDAKVENLSTAGDVSIASSAGSILVTSGDSLVKAAGLTLTAASAIGTLADHVNTRVTTLNATANAGGVYLDEDNGVTLTNITANGAGSDIDITSVTGDITLGSVTSADTVSIEATADNIFDDGDPNTKIQGQGDCSLSAGGVIGTYDTRFQAEVTNGTLSVAAGGIVGEDSVCGEGTITPVDRLTMLGIFEGNVWWNDKWLNRPDPLSHTPTPADIIHANMQIYREPERAEAKLAKETSSSDGGPTVNDYDGLVEPLSGYAYDNAAKVLESDKIEQGALVVIDKSFIKQARPALDIRGNEIVHVGSDLHI